MENQARPNLKAVLHHAVLLAYLVVGGHWTRLDMALTFIGEEENLAFC